MSFMIRKSHIRFTETELLESTAYLDNPSRGWYRIYSFALEEKPDFDELYWCLCKEEMLALVIADIGAFRAQPIPEEALAVFSDILDFFARHDKEMILRIVYDREGRGMEREPDFQQMVEEHMRQLGPVIREFAGSIFLVQGLFVGSWGEMHDSKFLSKERLRRLAHVWRDAIGDDLAIAVRTPQQWRLLHEETADCGKVAMAGNIGLFDDGMFGSQDNLGTYGTVCRREAGWEERWRREDELSWLSGISRYVPYGGEAVGTSEEGTISKAVEEMRLSGLTYLNRTHDKKRLDAWLQSTWSESGVWFGSSGLDYIGCHMGYRLVLRKAEVKQHRGEAFLCVRIENVGFAALWEETLLTLTFEAEDKECLCRTYPCDVCVLESGGQITMDLKLPEFKQEKSYQVFIQANRKRDGKLLFFANEPVAERVCLGTLTMF